MPKAKTNRKPVPDAATGTPPPLIIGVDDREKLPYTFECMRGRAVLPFEVRSVHFETGDYSAAKRPGPFSYSMNPFEGPESWFCVVERKSLADLYSTLGAGRERFEAEFRRLSLFGYAALVIESPWDQIMFPHRFLNHPTELNPKSVAATLIAWSQRFGVHVHALPGRDFAERWTFRLLERWVRDHIKEAQ